MGEPQDVTAERIVRDLLMPYARNDSNATINVHGASSWQMTVCVVAAVLGFSFGCFGLYIAADTRSDVRELRNDIKAIRAYINTGLLKPKGN